MQLVPILSVKLFLINVQLAKNFFLKNFYLFGIDKLLQLLLILLTVNSSSACDIICDTKAALMFSLLHH